MKKREPTEYPIQGGWRKKYKCHKNKGNHIFVVEYAKRINHQNIAFLYKKLFVYSRCLACNKTRFHIYDDV